MNQEGQKLSKRHGGFDMEEYKQEKILPAALLNFVALHGWRRRGLKSEVLTLEEMVRHVSNHSSPRAPVQSGILT